MPWLRSSPIRTRQPNPIENIAQRTIPPIGTEGNARTEIGTTVLRNIRLVVLVEYDQAIDRHGLSPPHQQLLTSQHHPNTRECHALPQLPRPHRSIEAFQNHGYCVPLLYNLQYWQYIVTFGLVTPPWRVPSSPASVQKLPWRNEWKVRADTQAGTGRRSLLTNLCHCGEAMLELSAP